MSDDKVRLWLACGGDPHDINDWFTDQLECDDVPYIARTVADDDAREERLREADERAAQNRELALTWKNTAIANAASRDEARERRLDCVTVDGLVYGEHMIRALKARAERAEAHAIDAERRYAIAEGRAERAEAERDSARALLKEARPLIANVACGHVGVVKEDRDAARDINARIDAALNDTHPSPGGGNSQVSGAAEREAGIVPPAGLNLWGDENPTHDDRISEEDRKGEDGEWCERGAE